MSRILIRAFIYMTLAALPPWIAWFTDAVKLLLEGKPPMTHTFVWLWLAGTSLYQALLALRAFLDGTMAREDAKTP